jgi:hypothetical protein
MSTENFEWLVKARCENQSQLLRLYRFSETGKNEKLLQEDSKKQDLFALLVGAAFSLWRAAFLSDTTRQWPATSSAAKELLKILLEDNAVPYGKDRSTKEWMGGYYLNNAVFRLLEARAILHEIMPDIKTNPALSALDQFNKSGIGVNADARGVWDILNQALYTMVSWLDSCPNY